MYPDSARPPDSGHLLHNLLLFGRLLRGLGLDVNPGRMIDLVHALEHIEIGRKIDFYHAARGLLVHRREDIPLFDQAFQAFWRKPPEAGWVTLDLGRFGLQRPRSRKPIMAVPSLRQPKTPAPQDQARPGQEEPPVVQVTMTYSAQEVLRHKDLADMTGDELAAVKHMIESLVWRLGDRQTRRRRPGHGPLLDMRRTVRGSLKHGGEVMTWARREPKRKPRPLVILADISGSMERYTRLLLHFVYSLTAGLQQPVETFVFSTRLTRISRQLRGRDVDRALRDVSQVVSDWSGGTRIGEALKTFNFEWGRRVLGRGAIVLLISDGWDRGDIDVLRREMGRLQRTCFRLIWLNPLLGSPTYEPLTRGMQAALPFIDDFLPVHNLASLDDLARHLAELDRRPAARRQARRSILARSPV